MKSILVVGARGIPDVEGSVEKNAERLFPLIASRGWKVCVAGWKPFIRASDYRGISLCGSPTLGLPKIDKLLYSVMTLFKAFRMRPDIVHFAGLEPASMLWAYKLIGCKTVVRFAGDCRQFSGNKTAQWALRCAQYQLRWADNIIAVTPALARKLRSSGIVQNINVIGNALDRVENCPEDLSKKICGDYILFVGRITRYKNIQSLIAAFRIFAKNHPRLKLAIAGEWDKSAGREKTAALGDNRIVMLGSVPRSELAQLYRGARLFVNPSIRGGHSNTLLEAISFGCPILLSDLPEHRDLRLNAKHYFRSGNIRSMVSALDRAQANPSAFRVNADRFPQWEDIAEQTIQVYEKMFPGDGAFRASKGKPSRI
jgi:glycosyltransferase involved in cell wall biosynthesis